MDTRFDTVKKEYFQELIRNGMAPHAETISVVGANGRVTAEPVYARICSPEFNACAMDGIALDSRMTFGAGETTPMALYEGQFIRVSTGDPLPDGCDAVIMIEDLDERDTAQFTVHGPQLTIRGRESGAAPGKAEKGTGERSCEQGEEAGGRVMIRKQAAPWQNIRQVGEDICAGEMILPSFSKITPSALGAMVAGGITGLTAVKQPVAVIIPVLDSRTDHHLNYMVFSAMLNDWGARAIMYPIVKDDPDNISEILEAALSESDIVILNSGATVNGEDHAADAIAKIGKVLHRGLPIKPGKPAILAYSGGKPVLGVPGYPMSGIIVLEQILHPIIEYLCCTTPEPYSFKDAVLSKQVVSTPECREFVRVRMGYVRDRLIASPLGRGAGIVTSFMKADGILEAPQGNAGYESGAEVSIRLLRPDEELRRSIVAIGSHDPLLDELSDLLRIEYGDISMGSAHVGSMGGLLAVRRGEAHLAGTHILDEDTGGYNVPFVRKMLPKGGVRLVECVKRTQGLMLAKGNPKKITCITDLSREGIHYVNRQKGSGTRILIDYLCRRDGADASKIYGYDREEYTHTSVAALIAAGSADAGLGIYSAAKLFDIDFVPVCEEQYDLLIPDHAWELPMVQALLEVMKSDGFRDRLNAMGGYVVEEPGTVRERF